MRGLQGGIPGIRDYQCKHVESVCILLVMSNLGRHFRTTGSVFMSGVWTQEMSVLRKTQVENIYIPKVE